MSSVFHDLIDQEAVITTLKDAVSASKDLTSNNQNMTHSWLFTGPPGSGRSNAAIAFAAALLCDKAGCATCINCTSVIDGSHADIELIRTEGLSIKVDEVRELITRTSWSPSVGNYRVVVIEDADRLTESAANALLKVIEEPGARTVWLLCAPTLTDVLPTIRSRCRHLTLRTPSIEAVTKLLIDRDGIDPNMAKFAASVAQGHIGRAKFLATNEKARENRENILNIPFSINDLASTFDAAETLVEIAKELAKMESETQDEKEIVKLKESYRSTGSKLATGGSKALKELEKEQKSRTTRLVRDNLDRALLDLATVYRDVLLAQSNRADKITNIDFQNKIIKKAETSSEEIILNSISSILKARSSLSKNLASNLTTEALLLIIRLDQ
jgi:DNA polymerase III subunit delta'